MTLNGQERALSQIAEHDVTALREFSDRGLVSEVGGLRVAVHVATEVVRRGLETMLRTLPGVGQVLVCQNASRLFELLGRQAFDLLILDFGDLDITVTSHLAQYAWNHHAKIILLVRGDQAEVLDTAASIPSNGFLVRDELTADGLARALAGLAGGDVPLPAALAGRLLQRAREGALPTRVKTHTLTPREQQVLELLAEGLSNRQIAQRLRISQHGVKRLVSNVLAKLNCPNRTLAVSLALGAGLLRPGVPGWLPPMRP